MSVKKVVLSNMRLVASTTLVLLFYINKSNESLTIPASEVSADMKNYLLNTGAKYNFETIGIIVHDEGRTSPIATYFMRGRRSSAMVVANAAQPQTNRGLLKARPPTEKLSIVLCFVGRPADVRVAADRAGSNPTFQIGGKFNFVISTSVTDTTWLYDTLVYIWRRKILNFVVVYETDGRTEVVGYDPFVDAVLNFTGVHQATDVFPDKVANLRGHRLTSAMYRNDPKNRMINGVLSGEDVRLFEDMARYLNGTPRILMVNTSLADALLNNAADFSFVKQFTFFRDKPLINPSYLLQLEFISVLVPTSGLKPQYAYLFEVFSGELWLCVLAALLVVIGFTHSKKCSFGIVQILLSASYDNLDKAARPLRIVLMSWVFFSLLLATSFNAKLLSFLVTPRYSNEITSIDELARSKLPIGARISYLTSVLDDLKMIRGQLVDTAGIIQAVEKYNKDKAYILPSSFAETLQRRRDKSNRQIYRMLRQHLAADHNAYMFQEDSPFKGKFETFLLRYKQHALGNFGEDPPVEIVQENRHVPLTTRHLQTAFYIVIFGQLVALAAFGVEFTRRR